MRFEPTTFDLDDEEDGEPSLVDETKPWLVGVRLEKPSRDDHVVQCAGIVQDGSRCTRTYVQKRSAALTVSYCFKHRYQQRLLFASLVMEIPHFGLASAFFFCVPMVLLANCMIRMMLVAWLPAPRTMQRLRAIQTA
ncbi:hypothetical protein H310_08145 [Aphanomyces invadans]|uniref:Uncharacterized protein n=1 Tax=Aphanomyces invadans TaxID=157072 RepID=A0A024TZ88_9STRA|nr:hypothetical protein H310_08145 [Aphanomyces invadans]ETV99465.1 hypothetical protein H310_08145 [Aphanomyces invadans]|eukprot:XP_008872021.1 hypothetical protein H310_08145 [Aphanomyces invadans]